MIIISYSTLQYGSSGSEVKKLQKELNKNGYKLDVDGQFGSKTQAAVRDYQKKNGLSVDGIVGKNTWGKLSSSKGTSKATSTTKASDVKTTPVSSKTRPKYEQSTAVKNAEKKLADWENGAPDEYNSKYSDEIEGLLTDILNREKFSYNLNADPLYEQYREQYTKNGKKAMEDTVGEAASLTGGYLNSYALSAGQQAYDEYLSGLNDVALDLRDRAFEEYTYEGDKLLEDVTLLRSLDGDDYEKYLNQLERYYKDGEYLLDKLTSMSDAEYERFLQSVEAWESDRDYSFDLYQDSLDRQEFEEELAFKKAEAERDQKNADREYALAVQKAASSGSGSSSSKSKSTEKTYITYPKTYRDFYRRTGVAGILTENEYDKDTAVKKKYGTYEKYLKAMYDKYS